jgi:ASPIC/UnbV protein/VCBS repeat protein
MGSNFGDVDDDGFLDFYLGTGAPAYETLMPNLLYHNEAGKRFRDVTMASGFGDLQKGHGVSFFDCDGDGDMDVFEQMGGAYAGDGAADVLFQNPGFGNHRLVVELVGTKSNRCAIGAELRAEFVDGDGTKRQVCRDVRTGGSFGCNPLRQTLGVGKAAKIDRLEIYWPRSDTRQTFTDVAVDRAVVVTEGKDELVPLAGVAWK